MCQDRYILPADDDNILSEIKQPPEIIKEPIIKCKRNEFDFYHGTEYSKYEVVPIACGGWNNLNSRGDFFTIYPLIQVIRN